MDIGQMVIHLRKQKSMSRHGWSGPGQYVTLQIPDDQSKMTTEYVYYTTAQGIVTPWFASQSDLLAQDWYIVA